ncbi:hypothetical protein Tco_0370911 [Tanacetum coccineum]
MLLNVDQLQKQLDKDEFQEDGSMTAFWVVNNQFQKFIDSKFTLDYDKSIRTDSTVQDDNSRSGNDTDADDADIRPIYDEEPMAEVQLTAECNIFAIGQQHTKQPEIIVEGRVDQYPETCQVKSPMLDSSPNNQTTEYSKQSLESENILLKETVAQFQKDFSRMEAHCIALELKYQNQSLKSGQHGQILNETSNKAKIEKEIDVLETMNIELEHSVELHTSKTTEQTTSLLANNAELKAQIQEKVFAIAALKNDLRKLKGNSFSPNKTSAVYEKTSPRSDLRWKPTGRIFKSVGLRWIPTGKLFDSCTSKVDSEPPHGLNVDIPHIHECKQTLDVSAGKSQSMVAEKADISETIVKVDSQMMIQKNDV